VKTSIAVCLCCQRQTMRVLHRDALSCSTRLSGALSGVERYLLRHPPGVVGRRPVDGPVGAVDGAYPCAGQVCCATERVIVDAAVHDAFVGAVLREAERVVLGDPFDDKTLLGPLNNESVAAKMHRHLDDARARGARILAGGQRHPGMPTDLYYEFTVVDAVPIDSLLSREESFGPVVPIITGRGEDDLLGIANDDKLGLQGAVFTRSMTSAFRFIEEMEVGQVVVNESNNWWDINMPFGGAGARSTGWGRIGGKWTLLDMTDTRTGVISI
jgi:acyl-CoA reductase-like NAD-dependent aldehyde dehydrogenase